MKIPLKISLKISRRTMIIGGIALVGAGGAAAGLAVYLGRPPPDRSPEVGAMLMLGFAGRTSSSQSARAVASHLAAGRASGVFFAEDNIGTREEVHDLVRLFTANVAKPPLIAIDHVGGAAQLLTESQDFTRIPPAASVAETLSPEEAKKLYAKAARQLKEIGFTVNLGPVVDLAPRSDAAAGGLSYGDDPALVTAYAEAFVDAFRETGIISAIKHFPGQGLVPAAGDGPLDVSATWSEKDLQPYVSLIGSGKAQLIRAGTVALRSVETEAVPAMLSPAVVNGLLREKLAFAGVVMTEDLDSAAFGAARRDAVIRAIRAGNDLLVLKNVDPFDPHLPETVVGWVNEAIEAGELTDASLADSAERIRVLRETVAPPPVEPEAEKSGH